ncbi:hypothetical protein [Aurantiacibacter hainanensis]|uniref:hypothetical protein n=1 Tax=Aurantiacibacter hainanensis TaxID=3076114 RepID=UPI0030C6CCFD
MKLTRRTLLAGVAAIPAVLGLDRLSAATPIAGSVFLFDASLPEATSRRTAAVEAGQQARAIEGDCIRFAREVVASGPAIIHGWSRQADALLIEEVAAEAGYRREGVRVEGAAITWMLVRRT